MRHHQQQHGHSNSTQGGGRDLESLSASHADGAAAAVAKAAVVAARATQHAGVTPAVAAAPAGVQTAADPLTEPLLDGTNTQQQLHQHTGGRSGQDGSSRQMSRMKEALLLCVPTGFDLAATTLMNVGLLYVAASGRVGGRLQVGLGDRPKSQADCQGRTLLCLLLADA